MQSVINNNN